MQGDGFKLKTKLPQGISAAGGSPPGTNRELNLEKRLNPLRKVKQGKKIGHYHGLHIMSHFPKV